MLNREENLFFSRGEVKCIARALYGLDARVKPLVGYTDQNFCLEDIEKRRFVFKVSAAGVERKHLEAQNAAMKHLVRSAGEMSCPLPCPTLEGDLIAVVHDKQGVSHFLRLFTYLAGKEIHRARYPVYLMPSLGKFLGGLVKHFESFNSPVLQRYSHWDIKHISDLEKYISYVELPGRPRLIEHFLDQFETHARSLFPQLRKGIIHNDANNFNLLVSEDEKRIAGIIDFELMVHSHILGELAVAAAYVSHYMEAPLEKIAALTAGFHSEFPLTETELEALFFMFPARLCATALMGSRQRKLRPDNPYMSISLEPAWEALEKLAHIDPEYALAKFTRACKSVDAAKHQ
ncbi:MAG: phosphotransferase [bacterium]|nr:phosphotransferase [bacterium]